MTRPFEKHFFASVICHPATSGQRTYYVPVEFSISNNDDYAGLSEQIIITVQAFMRKKHDITVDRENIEIRCINPLN